MVHLQDYLHANTELIKAGMMSQHPKVRGERAFEFPVCLHPALFRSHSSLLDEEWCDPPE